MLALKTAQKQQAPFSLIEHTSQLLCSAVASGPAAVQLNTAQKA
jgi:hypothetical protein